ncbi:glycosyltransferase family 4 protein [Uliginosibacterium sp. IMCC34675]|uniref:Glycosyltransferase family 4 protein n=2 Tax=Uliginosibacterium aquaticum TaxID=2731212 RepID=A0ABX2IHB7_9RHOO|nr:glycosyltransferase family 4 protein [Uliginosibacterium aquaticum]
MKLVLGVDAVRYPLTGIGRYTYELARGLEQKSEIEHLRYFAGHQLQAALPEPHLSGSEQARADSVRSMKLMLLKSRLAVGLHRGLKSVLQARALKSLKDYVYHGPNYYLPPHGGPCVATFHDLSMFKHPEFHPPERVRYMAQELPVALKRASVLLTDCEYTRQEIIEYSGFPADRVLSVPLAASGDFRPRTHDECIAVLVRLGVEYKRFVLFAGTIEPRKNISGLLDAYERLPEATRKHYPLVIAGYRGWRSEELHARIVSAQEQGWVRHLGFVHNADLPVLFSAAQAFAFPSFYEGFGLPVLEAMACGVPVVCSNASSLPEASGGYALSCDPEDIETLTMLLVRAIEDEGWRAEARINGVAHAATFSWSRVVSETMHSYRLALTL